VSTTVVIVVCRQHPWLVPCIESVLDQADEVVVVDNGSPAGWAAATARRLGAIPVRLERNTGFPGGVNAGIGAAGGDVVALLNDDAMADGDWLKKAAAILEDESVGAVTPKLLLASPYAEVCLDDEPHFAAGDPRPLGRRIEQATVAGRDVLAALVGQGIYRLEMLGGFGHRRCWRWTSGREIFYVPLAGGATPSDILLNGEPIPTRRVVNLINNAGSYLSAEGHCGDYGFETPDDPVFDRASERFAACGAAMAVRADAFRRLGVLAESFFAYYEDSDWCWRARLAGARVVYDPTSVVRHVRGVSSGGPHGPRVRFLAARNRLHCLARNAPLPVLRRQLSRIGEPGQPAGLARSLVTRLPRGLVERRLLARHWVHSPAEVFEQWAGVDETWPYPAPSPPGSGGSPEMRLHGAEEGGGSSFRPG
jgi:GT2 family glycosyltransferase